MCFVIIKPAFVQQSNLIPVFFIIGTSHLLAKPYGHMNPSLFYPALTGSKTTPRNAEETKRVVTAHKSLIDEGLLYQWG